ncbi:MAG: DNA polymerase III subunit epsilon [Holosporaceae bacterium]|jgi:DNA polymerase-3 subunit epsilon|nr:DNA polymerase III subunit epsilon [Holosporaceae bacterium]
MTTSKKPREIVLDTETTGLNYADGDRIIDIACVELINHIPTGNSYQTYVNPQRKMHVDAIAISGLTDEFLSDKPKFHEIVGDFLTFIGDSTLVIHNAKFDIEFLNSELSRLDKPLLQLENVVDTLEIARKKFSSSQLTLDALCRIFGIDRSSRAKHGALVDCLLLAEVYINLLGGRQSDLSFDSEEIATDESTIKSATLAAHHKRQARNFPASVEELEAHRAFIAAAGLSMWEPY